MVSLSVVSMLLGPIPSPRRNTDSTTESSVAVVSRPFCIPLALEEEERKKEKKKKNLKTFLGTFG
jgi:hypothetical protein